MCLYVSKIEPIEDIRHQHYHSPIGVIRMKGKHKIDRTKLLRQQYLSGEALVNAMPRTLQER